MKTQRILYFLSVFFLLFSLAPTGYEIARKSYVQPNRVFELVHNFPTDFNFYRSRIRQGIEGNATVREKYTSETHNGSFIHVFYLALGWAGRWTRTPWDRSGDPYHIARIILGITLLFSIIYYVRRAFPEESKMPISYIQILAFLLAVTASTWPKLVYFNNGWRFGGYMAWWSLMDSLQRITHLPHMLGGQILIICLLLALTHERVLKKGGNWIFLGFIGFLLGIIFPPGLVFVYAVLAVYTVFIISFYPSRQATQGKHGFMKLAYIATDSIKENANHIFAYLVFAAVSIPSLAYLTFMTSFYPWKRLAEFDILKPLPFVYKEYFLALGPIAIVGFAGLVLAFIKREKHMLLSASWVIAWLMLLYTFKFIPQQSPLRFSEMIPHAPLAVLSAFLFSFLYKCTGRAYAFFRPFVSVLLVSLVTVGFGVMYSSFLWQRDFIDHKMRGAYPLVPTGSYVMYPLKDFVDAIRFIQDATSHDMVILSETTAGNYIPVYAGNTVYVGHANTVKAEGKEARVREFFSGKMKEEEAERFFRNENIGAVFFGPQEKEDGNVKDLAYIYPFLQEAYKNTFVTVYIFK